MLIHAESTCLCHCQEEEKCSIVSIHVDGPDGVIRVCHNHGALGSSRRQVACNLICPGPTLIAHSRFKRTFVSLCMYAHLHTTNACERLREAYLRLTHPSMTWLQGCVCLWEKMSFVLCLDRGNLEEHKICSFLKSGLKGILSSLRNRRNTHVVDVSEIPCFILQHQCWRFANLYNYTGAPYIIAALSIPGMFLRAPQPGIKGMGVSIVINPAKWVSSGRL